MQWFRMYAEFAMDPVVQSLAFDDQRHFVMLLCLKCDGTLDRDLPGAMREAVILRALSIHGVGAAEAKSRLMDARLIDERWQPRAWEKRQRRSDADSTAAERQKRYRKSHVTEMSRVTRPLRNGDVTRPEAEAEAERSKAPEPAYAGSESIAGAMDAPPLPESSPETASTQGDDDAHSGVPRNPPCPVEQIVALYHAKLPMCRRVEQLTPNRRASLRARWRNELPTLEAFGNYFDDVAASRFLTGRVNGHGDRRPFVADFDWLLKPSNFVKVLEGKYHDGQ